MSVLPPLISDFADEAPFFYLDQFQDKPRLQAWLLSYVRRLQEAENVVFDVVLKRLLDNAADGQLDILGALVGEKRSGNTDAVYRAFISARIRINLSHGHADDVVQALRLVDSASFSYSDIYPAALEVQYDELPGPRLGLLASLVSQARAAGVAGAVVGSSFGLAGTLRYTYLDGETSTTVGVAGNSEDSGGRCAGFYQGGQSNTG